MTGTPPRRLVEHQARQIDELNRAARILVGCTALASFIATAAFATLFYLWWRA